MTGVSASFGGYARFGAQRAVDAANAAGGVFVRQYNKKIPVRLVMYDNESKAEKAAADVERLILRDEVVAITGLTGPERVLSGAEVAERYKVPVVTTGAALAAVGGVLVATTFTFVPTSGLTYLLKGFVVVVLGGMGSIGGTLLAGMLLGLSESLGAAAFGTGYKDLVGLLMFLLVLALRPSGLFGRR
jgi:hypothetical protein